MLTRAALLEAAGRIFSERGFHGASLDDIADAAGFSKGAVYSNFRSKEDLFLALVDDRLVSFVQGSAEILARPSESIASRIEAISELHERFTRDRAWALLYMEFYLYGMRNPEVGRRIIRHERQAFERITRLVDAELDALGLTPPIPTDELAGIVVAISEGLWLKQSLDPDAVPPGLFSSALSFLLAAVGALGPGPRDQRGSGWTRMAPVSPEVR